MVVAQGSELQWTCVGAVTLTSPAHERCSCRRAHPECVIRTERHAALDELVDGRRQRLVSVADAKVIVPSCPNACVRDKTVRPWSDD
jgi:hypothetical protein